MEGYCMKCKAKKEMQDPQQVTTKNGRMMTKGKCPDCGTTICKIGGTAKQFATVKIDSAAPLVLGGAFHFYARCGKKLATLIQSDKHSAVKKVVFTLQNDG